MNTLYEQKIKCFNLFWDGSYEERVYCNGEKNGEARLVGNQGDTFNFIYKEI